MPDQAEKLRQLVQSKTEESLPASALRMQAQTLAKTDRKARVLTITSGKGGVGKTSLATNLAIELALQGQRVIVFDADLSLANIDVLLGLRPRYNLNHVIHGEKTVEDVLVEGPHGIRIIPASSGVQALANLSREQLNQLTGQFCRLERDCDWFLIDTGAGISDNVMAFVHAADEVLIVTTPEPTAYTDAYAMIKIICEQGVDAQIGLAINMAQNRSEALNAAAGIVLISQKFLQVGIRDYGFVLRDPEVPRATRRQEAFTLYNPTCPASRNIRALAKRLLRQDQPGGKGGIRRFIDRFAAYFRTG